MQSFEERELTLPPLVERPTREDTLPTATLVREAIDDARRLVRLEVALAKNELRRELRSARGAGVAFGMSAVVAVMGVTLLFVAIALAFAPGPIPALIVGGILLFVAGCMALVGLGLLPKQPLVETRHRIESNVRSVKEHVV
jgi:Putative Actinobacterial Holin-X, holin superfamily III